jgi:multidrug resistance efflux pump
MLVSDNYAGRSEPDPDDIDLPPAHGDAPMSRRGALASTAVVLAALAVGFALHAKSASASTPGAIALAGDVRVDENVVRAPSIAYPTPDYTVGIAQPATAAPKKRPSGAPSASSSRRPVVSGFLSEMPVTQGVHVTKGQVVARIDTTMLDLGVRQARTARAKAAATLDVLDNNLDTMASARTTLVTARAQLVTARASLVATIGVLTRTRTGLETQIAAIEALISRSPPAGPPHVPPYPVLLAGLRQALSGLKTGLAGAKAGLAKMDQGLAKLSKGLAQLDSARAQLTGVRRLAAVNVDAQDVAVALAKARRDAATIVAPVDGLVTYARPAGTAVMVGAPLVRIRPDGPAHVYTYLTSDQLALVTVGSAASVTYDSNPGRDLTGHVSYIGGNAAVPPTSFPTSIVHMTRAVRVTIELDDGEVAPPGTPVDVEISTGS